MTMLALLLEGSLKGGAILVLALGITRAMRGRSAAARHLVWGIALLAAAAMPLASRLAPDWRVRLPASLGSQVSRAQAVMSPTQAAPQTLPAAEIAAGEPSAGRAGTASLASSHTEPAPFRGQSVAPLSAATALELCWVLVAATLLIRLLIGFVRLARLTRRAAPVNAPEWARLLNDSARSFGVHRPVRLLASEETQVPMTWGIVRPVVLLTPDYDEWSPERRRSVIRHELAHVTRWDAVTQLAAQVCCALYWFNPLVWMAARALRSERERACDDRVLAAGTRASDYAGELLEIARSAWGVEQHGVALAMARRSQLEGRLLSILDAGVRRETPGAVSALLLGVAALLLSAPLAAFRPAPAATEAAPPLTKSPAAVPRSEPVAPQPTSAAPVASKPVKPVKAAGDAAVPQRMAAAEPACEQGNSSHSSQNWSDNGKKTWRVSWTGDNCSVDLRADGDVKFNADFSDVTSITPGGYLEISVRMGGNLRRLEIRSEGGALRRTYSINGTVSPYDDAARAWLAGFLIELDRHTAFAVDARVPALLQQGGASAVLDEIDKMSSDYVRGVYYRKLLISAKLSPSEVRRVAKSAGTSMSSDYELGRVLSALAEQYSLEDAEVRTAFIDAAGTLESDYERAQLLLVVIS
ncbi:MAG TPA: M56 family metallopeptidase, partial [Gemmatimonadales bacterium]|nr:M56 family metallopeptidase [Gemmatimonadales bacterium]